MQPDHIDRVKGIFNGIAGDYDRVNTVISLGQIGRWRERLVREMGLEDSDHVLDLGCGTGELTQLLARATPEGEVLGVDLTPKMIDRARKKLPKRLESRVRFSVGKGENLDLPSSYFDSVASAFTLRNVTDISQVISELKRVVKPEGRVYTLELSNPVVPIFSHFYFLYFDYVLPFVGGLIHGDVAPYRYLRESLKAFPDQEKLKQIYGEAGLRDVFCKNVFGGIATIHSGAKRER